MRDSWQSEGTHIVIEVKCDSKFLLSCSGKKAVRIMKAIEEADRQGRVASCLIGGVAVYRNHSIRGLYITLIITEFRTFVIYIGDEKPSDSEEYSIFMRLDQFNNMQIALDRDFKDGVDIISFENEICIPVFSNCTNILPQKGNFRNVDHSSVASLEGALSAPNAEGHADFEFVGSPTKPQLAWDKYNDESASNLFLAMLSGMKLSRVVDEGNSDE